MTTREIALRCAGGLGMLAVVILITFWACLGFLVALGFACGCALTALIGVFLAVARMEAEGS